MKILYMANGTGVDYLNDCLLIGLKELYGSDVVDLNKQTHVYDTYDEEDAKRLYGKGMSVTRVLPDLEIDRDDVACKIKNRYYDYVVYGSVWRYNSYIEEVLNHYPRHRVVVVDGEDETNIHPIFKRGIPYFKREMVTNNDRLFPIGFSIPECKVDFITDKSRDFSYITPTDTRTYIYNNEADYYNDYKEARFGVTHKKAGWDCMRHYEVLANGCLPYFRDIDKCPNLTMMDFPKSLCQSVLDLTSNGVSYVDCYDQLYDDFEKHFKQYNTSSAAAALFIDTLQSTTVT